MNKKYIIKKNKEIEHIIKKGLKKVNTFFVVYKIKNAFNYNRYCVSIPTKLGNAVKRNRIKRQLKDILMKKNINTSSDYVIIVRVEFLKLQYKKMETELINVLGGK